jgi:hypothetical protein
MNAWWWDGKKLVARWRGEQREGEVRIFEGEGITPGR